MTRNDERWSTLRRLVTHRGTVAPSESRVSCGRLVACAAVAAALSGVLIVTSLAIAQDDDKVMPYACGEYRLAQDAAEAHVIVSQNAQYYTPKALEHPCGKYVKEYLNPYPAAIQRRLAEEVGMVFDRGSLSTSPSPRSSPASPPPPFPVPPAGPPPPPDCLIDSTITQMRKFIDTGVKGTPMECKPHAFVWWIMPETGYNPYYTVNLEVDVTLRRLHGRHDNLSSIVGRETFLGCAEDDDDCIAKIEQCRPGFEEVRALVCPR